MANHCDMNLYVGQTFKTFDKYLSSSSKRHEGFNELLVTGKWEQMDASHYRTDKALCTLR